MVHHWQDVMRLDLIRRSECMHFLNLLECLCYYVRDLVLNSNQMIVAFYFRVSLEKGICRGVVLNTVLLMKIISKNQHVLSAEEGGSDLLVVYQILSL